MDWCCECGKPMQKLAHGAYERCCNGGGYLSDQAPLEKDRWAAFRPKWARGLYLFLSIYLPAKKFTVPYV